MTVPTQRPTPLHGTSTASSRVETYAIDAGRLVRRIRRSDGTIVETDAGEGPRRTNDPAWLHAVADQRLLRTRELPYGAANAGALNIVDLFSGIGSLSLGVMEAARALGRSARLALAADFDQSALDVVTTSFGVAAGVARNADLGTALSGQTARPTDEENALLEHCPERVDVLVAGPPCQGHSRLNNHTRHDDPRNDLYACVARFVELRRPRLCIIENVDSVVNDQRQSALLAADRLRAMSYEVDECTVALHRLGVPQTRRRHVLVATRAGEKSIDAAGALASFEIDKPELRTVRWAIGDLRGLRRRTPFDQPSTPTEVNLERMRWLHDNGVFNLPNERRPDCHRLPKRDGAGQERDHSYRSMYGRLDWSKPAQTITSGYGSMGQGRYVHPAETRTLTPHEAARLQFIPDFMKLGATAGRGRWAKMIGNVAPMKLSYVFALDFLRQETP